MNPEVKAKWLDALRSKRYKQGYMRLKTVQEHEVVEYCCLGVLCDLHAKEHNLHWDENLSYLHETQILPPAVITWAGLNSYNPRVGKEGLVYHNDVLYDKFDKIADLIEEHL